VGRNILILRPGASLFRRGRPAARLSPKRSDDPRTKRPAILGVDCGSTGSVRGSSSAPASWMRQATPMC